MTDLASVFQPKLYKDTFAAINDIGAFDLETGRYGSPSTAYSIGGTLKKVAALCVTECINKGDKENQMKAEGFQTLLDFIAISVNTVVTESQISPTRRSTDELPPARKQGNNSQQQTKETTLGGGKNTQRKLRSSKLLFL